MDSEELVTISDGSNFTILVDGIKWAQPQLKKYYNKGKKQLFSITPPCDYQLKHEWPEPPFVNINTFKENLYSESYIIDYLPENEKEFKKLTKTF